MVRIASQHSWKDSDFSPACAWTEECYVQWGRSGLVLSRDGNHYRTAFFEAFPGDAAGGFIRGEGPTIGDAEKNAFEKYQRQFACQHRWGRRDYENGGAICYRCRGFKTVFKPIVRLGTWRKPISKSEAMLVDMTIEDGVEIESYVRRLMIRERLFGRSGEYATADD